MADRPRIEFAPLEPLPDAGDEASIRVEWVRIGSVNVNDLLEAQKRRATYLDEPLAEVEWVDLDRG